MQILDIVLIVSELMKVVQILVRFDEVLLSKEWFLGLIFKFLLRLCKGFLPA